MGGPWENNQTVQREQKIMGSSSKRDRDEYMVKGKKTTFSS